MRSVLTMAAKDLRLISRDALGMFFILVFPVLMGTLFGVIAGSFNTDSASLSIAVVDEDESEMSTKFLAALGETGNVQIEKSGRAAAIDRVRRGELVGLIAIPRGFGKTAGIFWLEGPAIEVGVDPSRQAEAGMLQGMIMRAAGKLMLDRFQNPGGMKPFVDQARAQFADSAEIPPEVRPAITQMLGSLDGLLVSLDELKETDPEGKGETMGDVQLVRIETIDVTREVQENSQEALVRKIRSRWDISFPQSMLWGVLGCAAGFAITIVRERQHGTFLRLQVAPISRAQILAGKATACFLAVVGVIILMVSLGVALGMRPRSPALLAGSAISTAVCFVGIMMLMSVIGKSEEAVAGAAWGANVLMAMFGGGMIPLAFMPDFMETISHFSPVKWAVLSLEGAIWRGFTPLEMMLPCGVLVAIGAVTGAIAITVLTRATR